MGQSAARKFFYLLWFLPLLLLIGVLCFGFAIETISGCSSTSAQPSAFSEYSSCVVQGVDFSEWMTHNYAFGSLLAIFAGIWIFLGWLVSLAFKLTKRANS